MRRLILCAALVCAIPAYAQDEAERDRSYLTGLIEDALSGAGREVRIDGFRGALSSTARFDQLTISDADGVWITVTDGALQWDRGALLSGAIDIDTITVGSIDLPRLPKSENTGPSPTATEFKLPELPVSLKLGELRIDKATLGESILGQPLQMQVTGSAQLAGGEGSANLALERTDSQTGEIKLQGSFENDTDTLVLSLSMVEGEDGLFANAVDLPGTPPIEFTANGQGPLSDFAADITLATDGTERLGGTVRLSEATPEAGLTEAPARRFEADISGDIQPLFEADYARFFGPDTHFVVKGERAASGVVDLSQLSITSQALQLSGNAQLAPSGLPTDFDLDATLGGDGPVLLPISGTRTYVDGARLLARYSAEESDAFSLQGVLRGFERSDMSADLAVLSGTGTIASVFGETGGQAARVSTDLGLDLFGFSHQDPALQQALGNSFSADMNVTWRSGDPVQLSNILLTAGDLTLTGNAAIDGVDSQLDTTFDAKLTAGDFGRFALIAGMPQLAGSGIVTAKGRYAALSGAFDAGVNAEASSLRTGIAQLDALTGGQTQIVVDGARDETGTTLRQLAITSAALQAETRGRIGDATGNFTYDAQLDNIGRLADGINGPATLSGSATTTLGTGRWDIDANATGPGGTRAALNGGIILAPGLALDMRADGTAPLALANAYLTDMSVQGNANFDLALNGAPALDALSGTISVAGARLSLPALGEALTDINANVQLSGAAAQISVNSRPVRGGTVSVQGSLGLAPPLPANLDITLAGARIVDPSLYRTSVDGTLALRGPLQAGGQLTGTVTLGRTEIAVPSGAIGAGTTAIPEIAHIGEPSAVRASRGRAKLIGNGGNGGATIPIGLDIRVLAPNQIFVRGRGLDAELGGTLRITGSTADVIPIGQFDLVRGRLDILGKRFVLDEGSLALRGSLTPRLRLVADTQTDTATVSIVLEGPSDDLNVSFTSSPELPDDEILAQLLFGKDIRSISALQAAQLASAVVTLAGKGGEGVVGKLRRNFGLDDLDVTTTDGGATELRVGKYLTDNIYSNVAVDSEGHSKIELNLDITPSITGRGTLASDGETGLGVFFEKDY